MAEVVSSSSDFYFFRDTQFGEHFPSSLAVRCSCVTESRGGTVNERNILSLCLACTILLGRATIRLGS